MIYVEETDSGNESDSQEIKMRCAEVHINRLGKLSFKCQMCDESFKRFQALKDHLETHFNVTPVQCFACNLDFKTFDQLVCHSQHCFIPESDPASPLVINDVEQKSESAENLSEEAAHNEFQSDLEEEYLHIEAEKSNCQETDKDDSDEGTIENKQNPEPTTSKKVHQCSFCQRTFKKAHSLRLHSVVHTGERPYKCKTCEKTFRHPSTFREHMIAHMGELRFQCAICGNRYITYSAYKCHVVRHSNLRLFQCSFCDRRFNKQADAKLHERMHTDERPHQCQECGKKFRRLPTLQQHSLLHTGEKRFSCRLCGKAFAQKPALARHIKNHPALEEDEFMC